MAAATAILAGLPSPSIRFSKHAFGRMGSASSQQQQQQVSMGLGGQNMLAHGVCLVEAGVHKFSVTLHLDHVGDAVILGAFVSPNNDRIALDTSGRLRDGTTWVTGFSRPLDTGDSIEITHEGDSLFTLRLNKGEETVTHTFRAFAPPPLTPFILLHGTRVTTRGVPWNNHN